MTKIIELLLLIGRLLSAVIARGQFVKDQKDNDKLHEDPAGWFDDHFGGGVRDDQNTPTKADNNR